MDWLDWRKSSFCETGACVEVRSSMEWKKSARSAAEGNCVEVGTGWQKSTRSGAYGDNCVEVQRPEEMVFHVRDSKDTSGPVLTFTKDEWDAFIAGAKAGEFDS